MKSDKTLNVEVPLRLFKSIVYKKERINMAIKISDLIIPKEKLEKEYHVVNLTRWQKDGEVLGWSYECILPKLRYKKNKRQSRE